MSFKSSLGQGTHTGQNTELLQGMMMSEHMQQAMHLLQLPVGELQAFLEEQIVANPLLEWEEEKTVEEGESPPKAEESEEEVTISDHDLSILSKLDEEWVEHFSQSESSSAHSTKEDEELRAFQESQIVAQPSMLDLLLRQIHENFTHPEEFAAAELLIGYLDSGGLLTTPLQEIASFHLISPSLLENILKKIRTFEPFGVGASSLQEALLLQLLNQGKKNSLAYGIISTCYQELLHHKIHAIQKKMHVPLSDIEAAIERDIRPLNLRPVAEQNPLSSQFILPDVTLRLEGEQLIVEIEKEWTPRLHIRRRYLRMLRDPSLPKETKQFIKRHFFSARWLARNLEQRYTTIERVAKVLARRQRLFFTEPTGQLLPMTMKSVAEELGLHESTIARTVSRKYIDTPRGLLSVRALFTAKYKVKNGREVSSKTVQDAIVDIVKDENKASPLSDDKISTLLKDRGIVCARRTVAKLRGALLIGSACQRRKYSV